MMTIITMPLRMSHKWPKSCGFDIFGEGPSYVLSVAKGSIAFSAGLSPGDEIIELDGEDVTNASATTLKSLAKHSRSQPPTLGVITRVQLIELVSSRVSGCGFDVQGNKPVRIKNVELSGPAHQVGIKPGDVLLEINGFAVRKQEDIRPFLNGRLRRLSISVIPTGKRKEYKQVVKKNVQAQNPTGEWGRVKRAKSLHERMNEILGSDYEKKMAVVSVLKQYAEDRDVDMLARALAAILKTPKQTRIIQQIRQFIPPKQRSRFDEFHKYQRTNMINFDEEASKFDHAHTERRVIQVFREGGSFGFVIKGNNPVCIESVDPMGAADKGGLQAGDVILKLNNIDVRRCTHAHLVQLLQDSGSSPEIEVLRTHRDGGMSSFSMSTMSLSSISSHASSEWMKADGKEMIDSSGNSFKSHAEYLLTSKERSHMRKAMIQYDTSRNIVDFYNKISLILDTQSKKTLWKFILLKLTPPHQEYCLNKINLSEEVLLEVAALPRHIEKADGKKNSRTLTPKSKPQLASFQQQCDYLLTSRERTLLKRSLRTYAHNRNVESLIQSLELILDTPSKHTLWMYIIPLLITEHQKYTRERLNIPTTNRNSFKSGISRSHFGSTKSTTYGNNDEDFKYVGAAASALKRSKGRSHRSTYSSDEDIRDRSIRSGVRKARGRLWKKMHPGYTYSSDDIDLIGKHGYDFERSRGGSGKGYDVALMKELEETRKAVQEAKKAFQSNRGSESEEDIHSATKYVTVIPIPQFEHTPLSHHDSPLLNGHTHSNSLPNGLNEPPEIIFTSESDSEVDIHPSMTKSLFSLNSKDSFNTRALTALKELDAAMAAEASDLELGPLGMKRMGGNALPTSSQSQSSTNEDTDPDTDLVAIPPPPAPPPPPPPPPPSLVTDVGVSAHQVNVKRINWEKIDPDKVENTVWEQLGNDDLDDVIKYLELENHFSTQNKRTRVPEKRNEIYILNPKKAYNISILLGHLRLSVEDMKLALYEMDEEILTPELLRQLVAFAPSKTEMEHFNAFDGEMDELSKPDIFAYEMSRVPGYEQRLKALLFKGNFNEKITEMKENLQYIRKASKELRHSRKLAKLLELILAMGNYMNKGNQRVGEAFGFKISFLSQLDITKTKDNKSTFIHVLADAVVTRFPDVLTVGEDLSTVMAVGKGKLACMSNIMLNQELQELRKVLQEISNTLDKFGSQKTRSVNDRFQDVMGHFISQASDEIQGLFRLQANTMDEFQSMVQYFGEDPKKTTTTEIFGIFADFITKFELTIRT
ncbi:delphilin-like isoform X2 [Ostrea edulis]|uniref:delphilin-like isoform X2 n=1 Tax=Ostrea edulis TaxID=37623 RepID=UPI0024AEF213|nr:delphilin-like isoform X2 [Ostrea edulis]